MVLLGTERITNSSICCSVAMFGGLPREANLTYNAQIAELTRVPRSARLRPINAGSLVAIGIYFFLFGLTPAPPKMTCSSARIQVGRRRRDSVMLAFNASNCSWIFLREIVAGRVASCCWSSSAFLRYVKSLKSFIAESTVSIITSLPLLLAEEPAQQTGARQQRSEVREARLVAAIQAEHDDGFIPVVTFPRALVHESGSGIELEFLADREGSRSAPRIPAAGWSRRRS